MKKIKIFDDYQNVETKTVDDDYVLKDNEFLDFIEDNKPTQNQQLFMNLSQNVATLQSMVMAQNQQIAQLMTKEAN